MELKETHLELEVELERLQQELEQARSDLLVVMNQDESPVVQYFAESDVAVMKKGKTLGDSRLTKHTSRSWKMSLNWSPNSSSKWNNASQ